MPSLDEALAMLAAKHVEHVYVQPGHIAAGEDYRQKLQPMLDAHAQEFTMPSDGMKSTAASAAADAMMRASIFFCLCVMPCL